MVEEGVGQEVGREHGVERPGRACRIEDVEEVAAAEVGEQAVREVAEDLVDRAVAEALPG